jgi:superfamily II DNA/RNA helicase
MEERQPIDEPADLDKLTQLRSDKTWEEIGVPKPLADKLIQLNYKNPSKIQEQVIPASFTSSVFGQSQNGSGKTLSFLIPAILHSNPQVQTMISGMSAPQVIILADTRALITQIHNLAKKIAQCSPGLRVEYSFSGVNEDVLDYGHIFITTAKRLSNMLAKKKIDFSQLNLIILDEADQVMTSDASDKFIPKLFLKILPLQVKTILTSATVTPMTQMLVEKTDEHKHYRKIEVKKEELTLKNVQQYMIKCSIENRLKIIEAILEKVSASNILIFGNSRTTVHDIQNYLSQRGNKVITVSSNTMDDRQKEAEINQYSIEQFMKGEYRILIATGLLSRGIDMRKVNLVINVELPLSYPTIADPNNPKPKPTGADPETYLHRVGRTGRFGDRGIAINMITDDTQERMMGQIIDYYSINMTELNVEDLSSLNIVLKEIDSFNQDKRALLEENI